MQKKGVKCHENKHSRLFGLVCAVSAGDWPISLGCRQLISHYSCIFPLVLFWCHSGIVTISITYEGTAVLSSAIAFNQPLSLIYTSCCPWDCCTSVHCLCNSFLKLHLLLGSTDHKDWLGSKTFQVMVWDKRDGGVENGLAGCGQSWSLWECLRIMAVWLAWQTVVGGFST